MHAPKHNGFTLIELSIVLVIIGLIVGGVLVGKDLIKAAELRSIASDKEKFVAAVYAFKEKYNALPGDFKNAQSIWGAAASCTTTQTTTATCNGDGDGSIERGYGSGTVGNETFLFWKHLANAGLIQGNYTGITDGTSDYGATTKNSPSSKIAGGLWYLEDFGTMSGSVWAFDGKYNNTFELGYPVANKDPWYPLLTAKEMLSLDSKIDDGKPGKGTLVTEYDMNCSAKSDGVTANTYSDGSTAVYRTTSTTGVECNLLFPNVF